MSQQIVARTSRDARATDNLVQIVNDPTVTTPLALTENSQYTGRSM